MIPIIHSLFLALLAAPLFHAAQPNIVIPYADDIGYGDLGANNPESKIPDPQPRPPCRRRHALHRWQLIFRHLHPLPKRPPHWQTSLARLSRNRQRHGRTRLQTRPTHPARHAQGKGLHHRLHRQVAPRLGLGCRQAPRRQDQQHPAMGKKKLCLWSRRLRLVQAHPRRPDRPGIRSLLRRHRYQLPPPAAGSRTTRSLRFPTPPCSPEKSPPKPRKVTGRSARSDWNFYQVLPTLADKGVAWIEARKNSDQPFFLYLPFPSPHAPIIPNDEFDGKFQAGPYGDFVYQTDHICGRLLEAVKKSGKADNTIFIFTSDKGPEHYAYARDAKYDHWSSGPLRGSKRDIYEGGHHVPFVIKWPGLIKPGSVSNALISQTDITTTLAAGLNYDLPSNSAADSFDFLPYLKGDSFNGPRTTMVHNTYQNAYALRQGNWVLIKAKSGARNKELKAWLTKHKTPAEDRPVGLYNLKDDLGQRHNLADKTPEKVAQLQAKLKEIRAGEHTAPSLG